VDANPTLGYGAVKNELYLVWVEVEPDGRRLLFSSLAL
jgi:hypothetical protein